MITSLWCVAFTETARNFGKNPWCNDRKKPRNPGLNTMLRQIGQAMAENAQKSEMDFRVFSCSASQAGNRFFFHDTDSGTVLFAQRSGVVGIAEQAGVVSHDEGGEDIQKLLFF